MDLNKAKDFGKNIINNKRILQITCAILILLVVLLIINNYTLWKNKKELQEKSFSGMWIAPESFTKKADVEGMMVYIGPVLSKKLTCGLFRGYVLVWSQGKTIAQEINIEKYRNKIVIETEDDDEIFPETMSLEIQTENGWMQWYCDDEIYAELYKDNFSSMF